MRRCTVIVATAMLALVLLMGSAEATSSMVDARVTKQVPLVGVPMATAIAADGKTIFVLSNDGTVAIFEPGGRLRGMVQVGAGSTDIAASPDGHSIYVTDRGQKTLRIVELDYIISLHVGNAPFLGPPDAPVIIVVFSDFQCPYCAKLNPILRQVMKKYPQQVRLAYKFLPLTSIHKVAMRAAIAALAAERQGKFWSYHDGLLADYGKLSEKKLLEIGEACGLEMEQFARDRKDPRLVNRIRNDMKEAGDKNVRSVPSVFINGRLLRSRSLKSFDQAIMAELHRLDLTK